MSESDLSPLPPEDDWVDAKPDIVPKPTFWPAGLAFGTTFFLWGFLTSTVLLVVGGSVLAVSLWGWIGDMRHEHGRS